MVSFFALRSYSQVVDGALVVKALGAEERRVFLGALRRIDSGPDTTRELGYINRGGTLDVAGMLFALFVRAARSGDLSSASLAKRSCATSGATAIT
mgnify:CR=1 FL=1